MSFLPSWLNQLIAVLLVLLPFVLWFAFCLWAINWKKMWPWLAEGAWVPVVLLVVLVALVWSQIAPRPLTLFRGVGVPNFWWQLVAVSILAGLGLFAGWVQRNYAWYPDEIPVEPPDHGHEHDHGHGDPADHTHGRDEVHPTGDHAPAHAHGHH